MVQIFFIDAFALRCRGYMYKPILVRYLNSTIFGFLFLVTIYSIRIKFIFRFVQNFRGKIFSILILLKEYVSVQLWSTHTKIHSTMSTEEHNRKVKKVKHYRAQKMQKLTFVNKKCVLHFVSWRFLCSKILQNG